jgi:hypothetical protein
MLLHLMTKRIPCLHDSSQNYAHYPTAGCVRGAFECDESLATVRCQCHHAGSPRIFDGFRNAGIGKVSEQLFGDGAKRILSPQRCCNLKMAFVTITEAAQLVRRSRRTLYRDIDKGRLSKTIRHDGGTVIDTAELLRVYGELYKDSPTDEQNAGTSPIDDFEELVDTWEHPPLPKPPGTANGNLPDNTQMRILQERIKSLEHVLALEATLRKVKDEVTNELRARLEDKERVIKMLQSKLPLLEYDESGQAEKYGPQKPKGLFARLFNAK